MKFNTLHVNTQKTWGGGEQQTLLLARGLVERGHQATVVCQPGSPLAERCRRAGLPVEELRMRGEADFRAAWALRRIIRQGGYDIVHLHTAHAHTLGAAAVCLARRCRCIVSRRVIAPVAVGLLSAFKYHHGVARYIAISEAVRDTLLRGGVEPERVVVVHSGIELDRLAGATAAGLREELGLPTEAPVVGHVGALTRAKGQRTLLEAVPLVLEAEPQARFVIVGDGELGEALQARARELDIAERVVFTGFRSDVPRLLALFDVFCMPSLSEGLCTSALEALALSKPVVASAVGGLPEIVRDGQTGLLVPPGDAKALAEALVRLLRDRQLAATLGQRGKRLVEAEFTADAMVEGTLRVYREVMNESTGGQGVPAT